MPGIDSYTKLMLHCNGIDGSTSFPDASDSAHTVTATADAQVDTSTQKFGTGSAIFDGVDDSLYIADSPDWDLGSGDFTIDCWVNFADTATGSICSRFTNAGSYFYWSREGSSSWRFRDWGGTIDFTRSFSNTIDTWYHVAVVRYGNDFKMYVDGTQIGTTYTSSASMIDRATQLDIGVMTQSAGYALNGHIDEFRFSKGIARWTSNFTPPTEEYSEEGESTEINETILLDDDWIVYTNPGQANINEIINIDDNWTLQTNPALLSIDDTIILDDSWNINTNPGQASFSETVQLSEDWTISQVGDLFKIYATNLTTTIGKIYKFLTNLTTNKISINKYDTNLITIEDTSNLYNTDLRVRVGDYDSLSAGNISDIIVKLDGSVLSDVDYNTLKIQYNLNSSPSFASFQLARRHDNFDYLIDGTTLSTISNENKIEIYDGTYKLLTAYITQIDALSTTDTVLVTAQDARYKLSRNSMEIEYGGKIEQNEEDPEEYDRFEKNIGTALSEVLSAITPYISGHESIPFSTTYTPEYTQIYTDYASLLNSLLQQVANVNWYLDENEYLRFQKIDNGTIKALSLSSLSGARSIYDVILSDVTLNKQNSGYTKSLNVKLGTHINQYWSRRTFTGWLNSYVDFYNRLKDKVSFCFQQWGEGNYLTKGWYCGINKTIYGYNNGSWVLKPTIVVQWQSKDSDDNLDDINIGSGSPQKTLRLDAYGKKSANIRWEERINESDEKTYLCYVQDETYDRQDYALDFAYFDLSQNNKLQTSAEVSLLLDAYKYYGIKLKDRINLSNTIGTDIYQNNNGFPLHIDSITIDCSTRTVLLNLTNYGKSWGVKTANYLTNQTTPSVRYVIEKQDIVRYSGGV